MPEMFDHSNLTREVLAFRCPRWDELPAIELYMDQLTGYINEIYAPLANPAAAGDFTLTKAMVNNYVKMRVIERPVNKKYSRVQLARLVTLCAMKQVLSLPELSALSEIGLARYPMPKAYNYFCVELENALQAVFTHKSIDPVAVSPEFRREVDAVHSMTLAIAHKVYVQRALLTLSSAGQPSQAD